MARGIELGEDAEDGRSGRSKQIGGERLGTVSEVLVTAVYVVLADPAAAGIARSCVERLPLAQSRARS